MSKISKLGRFIKNSFEWIIAILAVISGFFVVKYLYNRFFGSSYNDNEEILLQEIEENEQQMEILENTVVANLQEEEQLHKEQIKLQEKINKLKEEYKIKQQEFINQKENINNSTHNENIDYMNKKYN